MQGFQALILVAAGVGVGCGLYPIPGQAGVAKAMMTLFMNALKMISLPIVFLSVATTLCGMDTVSELTWLGRRVLTYTLGTTVLAACVALGLYLWIHPAQSMAPVQAAVAPSPHAYLDHLVGLMPSSIFQPFMDGNVIGVLLLALAWGIAMIHTPGRQTVHAVMSACLAAFMKMTRALCGVIPLVVWAGVVQSFTSFTDGAVLKQLARYLACVVAANMIQALVCLPLLLRLKGLHPWRSLYGLMPALGVAFFSKSSVAALPMAMSCAETRLNIAPRVSKFTFPICTTVNMNGCAAFIFITVLFVATLHGHTFAPWDLGLWVIIATLAAVGNAGVPMGCYFLASALLAAMDVPLTMMALILPFYSFLDMLETAVNVWSDTCVALLVNQKYQKRPQSNPMVSQQAA